MKTTNKRHVLFFSKEGRGGIETFLEQMKHLEKNGYLLNYAFFKKDNLKMYRKSDIFLSKDYPSEVNFSVRKVKYFFQNIKNTIKLIKKNKPNIVFAIDIYSLILLSTLKHSKLTKFKLVCLVNTNIYHILKTVRKNFFSRFILVSFFKLIAKSPDAYVFTSTDLKDDMILKLNVPLSKCVVIPHSVDLNKVKNIKNEKLKPKEKKLFSNKYLKIVSVGRLEDQKDFRTILLAFQEVLTKIPNSRLYIVGDGQEKKDLVNFTYGLKISKNVFFLGWKRNTYKYLTRSDIFIFSSFYEGFAMVIVEAMACGLPVIATNTPFGPSEILKDGEYGKLVKVGDYKNIAVEIFKFYKNKSTRIRMSKKGLNRVKKYDTKLMLKSFDKILSTL